MIERPTPTTCKMCGKDNCDDWMYNVGLVSADQAICGKCKIELGNAICKSIGKAKVKVGRNG